MAWLFVVWDDTWAMSDKSWPSNADQTSPHLDFRRQTPQIFRLALNLSYNVYESTTLLCLWDTTVMLMFQPPQTSKLFRDQFPVVWKVITFRAKGHAKAVVQYVPRLAFGYAQTDSDNLVDSAAWVEVKSGDISSISGGPGQKRFGDNAKGSGTKLLVCQNNTHSRANLSLGLVKGDGINQRYEPVLIWTGVGSKSNIATQFTPILTAYVTREYRATEMLRGEVETDAIWSCNLNELEDVTGWNFMEDETSGAFIIEQARTP
ncbi:hypothetical protein CTheo_4218 [Ceratobasidium theobromae]|uniref:Uncharacterized protein n=1 Tax=Ceratobasidium theobromae TaxID=1582974 RepID=A0A5N5QM45_9AGAM|nr:hypothetical protein CTheo_4218 [Ceratobasidium theobromae]